MNKYERLYTEASAGGKNPSWLDTAIRPLAADLAEATGLPARVSGPFGLRAECLIYLNENGAEGERKHITITPWFNCEGQDTEIMLYYDTGEVKKEYEPHTLGDYNGMNNVMKRLPETLPEIVALLHTY